MLEILGLIVDYWYIFLLILAIIVVLIVILVRKGILKRAKLGGVEFDFTDDSKSKDKQRIFSRSDSAEFAQYFESKVHQADRIVLIGTGINIIQRDPVFLDLMERVEKGKCTLEIYLANPFSRQIEMRLVEEEIGNIKPPVGRLGLIQRLETILRKQQEMGSPQNFVLRLFWNYPTSAMFIIDTEYFLYPYGFSLLGNLSPISHYSKNNPKDHPIIDYIEKQYQQIKIASANAQLVMDLYHRRSVNIEELTPFAVYLIPVDGTPLYEFGSDVLGYDVRGNSPTLSHWASSVGPASEFGFHLTLADALYLGSRRELDLLIKEIEYISLGFKPFPVFYSWKESFPNANSVALACTDESGMLESLHLEMLARCYRQAIGSNYSLGIAPTDRGPIEGRNKLMVQRYHAPYIMQQFKPHFTLLTNLPQETSEREAVTTSLYQAYQERIKVEKVDIGSICVMTRTRSNRPWQIAEEISLS